MENLTSGKASVTIVEPPGYPHSSAFREIAETVCYGLDAQVKKIGINSYIEDGLNIICGAHLLTPKQMEKLPECSVIYNLEQVGPSSMWGGIKPLLGRFPVWDYSMRNIEAFRAMGFGGAVFHVPIGHRPEMTRIKPAANQDIDVLFYGSINERRKNILEALSREGLRVKTLFGVYGAERDAYIARAKVVLNLHFYESSIFELVRVSYLLQNRKAVVAECNENTEIDGDILGAFVPARYERLVHECKALVKDGGRRKAVEAAALERFSARDEGVYLEAGLAWANSFLEKKANNGGLSCSFPADFPKRMNMGSGKDFRPEFLNVDWNDYWGPDVVLDLNEPLPFGKPLSSARFGEIILSGNSFDEIIANDLFEHIRELPVLMTSCLKLLKDGGELRLKVPYDLSYGAWQDPTHVRAFNEKSWLYYTDWFWYMGWRESRFDLALMKLNLSDYGNSLRDKMPDESLLRQPRAVDDLEVVLRKRPLTREELDFAREKNNGCKNPYVPAKGRREGPVPPAVHAGKGEERVAGTGDMDPDCEGPVLRKDGSAQKEGPAREEKDDAGMSGLVSIVVAVPNRIKEIQKCLGNIEKHTPEPHEVVLVASEIETPASSATARWLKKHAAATPGYKFIEASGAGYAALYNEGVRASSGRYIVFLDSGVDVAEGWLQGMLGCMKDIERGPAEEASGAPMIGPVCSHADGLQKAEPWLLGEEPDKNAESGRQERSRDSSASHMHRRIPVQRLDDFCILTGRALFDRAVFFDEVFGSRRYAVLDLMQRAVFEGSRCFIAAGAHVYRDSQEAAKTEEDDRSKNAFENKWGSLDPQRPEAKKLRALGLFESGVKAEQKGDLGKAVENLVEAIKSSPMDNSIFSKGLYYRFARVLIRNGEFGHALEVLSKLPDGEGTSVPHKKDAAWLELAGYCKDGLGEALEAEKLARAALDLNRGAGALNLMGLIEFKKGAPEDSKISRDKAALFFDEAIKADGGYGEAYANLGALRWAEGRQEEAFGLFENAFILTPASEDIITNYYSALIGMSGLSGKADLLGRAVEMIKQAIFFYPAKKRLRHILAEFYFRNGRNKEALEVLEDLFLSFGADDDSLSVALRIRDMLGPKEIVTSEAGEGKDKKTKTLSVCMIAKNEEKNIVRTLLNLRPAADELVVVDTGSSDRTKDIARALGARVFDFAWTGDFSAARNFSLSKARGEWILVMDADEVISPADRKELRELTDGKTNTAYAITTRNYVLSPGAWGWVENDGAYAEEAGTGWVPSTKARLFPNDEKIRFRNPVHELVEASLEEAGIKVVLSSIPIHHYGKLISGKVKEKGSDYYEMGKTKLSQKGGDDFKAAMELAVQAGELRRWEECLENWRKVASIRPGYREAYLGMADALWGLGRYKEAMQAIDDGFASPLDRMETSHLYARCQVFAGEAEAAVSLLEKSTSKHPMVLSTLALACLCTGRKARAVELSKQAGRSLNMPALLADYAKKLIEAGRSDYAAPIIEHLTGKKIADPAMLANAYLRGAGAGSPDLALPGEAQGEDENRASQEDGSSVPGNAAPCRPEASGNILVIDPRLPWFDKTSGSLRLFSILRLLKKQGYHVTYIARDGMNQEDYIRVLEKMGIEVHATDPQKLKQIGVGIHGRQFPKIDLKRILAERSYEIAILSFYDIAEQYLPEIRACSPKTKILIDTVDIHFVREQRMARLNKNEKLMKKAKDTMAKELAIYRKADAIITVTEKDWEQVKDHLPGMAHYVIPNIHAADNGPVDADGRSGLVFVGNFNHLPNVDAVSWFLREIFPKVKEKMPDMTLTIVGPHLPNDIVSLKSDDIIVAGYVPKTEPYLKKARVSIAPLRYGAGMKGKIGEAMSHGLPVVTTSIGAEGMGLAHGETAMIADTPESFAECVVRLCYDDGLWRRIAASSKEFIGENFSFRKVGEQLAHMLGSMAGEGPAAAPNSGSRRKTGNVLVLGIYLADQANNVDELVKQFNAPRKWKVTQKWAAIGNRSVNGHVGEVTYKQFQEGLPKFTLLNRMLSDVDLQKYDYVVVCDDDIKMEDGFLDRYLDIVGKYDFALAQPARTHNSFIDHHFVEQMTGLEARRTLFVEIGPLFSVRKDIYADIFPFDETSPMGWGYDFVWPCVIERRGLRMGIVDAVPVDHSMRKPVKNYSYDEARAHMEIYLSKNKNLSRGEAFRILETYA